MNCFFTVSSNVPATGDSNAIFSAATHGNDVERKRYKITNVGGLTLKRTDTDTNTNTNKNINEEKIILVKKVGGLTIKSHKTEKDGNQRIKAVSEKDSISRSIKSKETENTISDMKRIEKTMVLEKVKKKLSEDAEQAILKKADRMKEMGFPDTVIQEFINNEFEKMPVQNMAVSESGVEERGIPVTDINIYNIDRLVSDKKRKTGGIERDNEINNRESNKVENTVDRSEIGRTRDSHTPETTRGQSHQKQRTEPPVPSSTKTPTNSIHEDEMMYDIVRRIPLVQVMEGDEVTHRSAHCMSERCVLYKKSLSFLVFIKCEILFDMLIRCNLNEFIRTSFTSTYNRSRDQYIYITTYMCIYTYLLIETYMMQPICVQEISY